MKNFYKYRFLLLEIVRKNIKLQYRNSVLGMFWTFLQPLLTTMVLVLVFGTVFGNRDNPKVVCYPIFLLCGRLAFEFYTQATKKAMRSVRNNAGIIKKVYVPKYIYPLANVLSSFIMFLISQLVLVAFLIYFRYAGGYPVGITRYTALVFVPILLLLLLCLGVGLILAVLEVFFKDIEYLYDVFCTLLFYLTPIFYHIDSLGISGGKRAWFGYILKANPLYSIVSMYRDCILYGTMIRSTHFWYALGFGLVTLSIGLVLFVKKQDKFILYI